MSRARPIINAFLKGRFGLFLATMMAMFFVMPMAGKNQGVVDNALGWFSIAVLLSCLRAISSTRKFFMFMACLTLVNVMLTGLEMAWTGEAHGFLLAVTGFKVVYFVLVFYSIMRFVLMNDAVTEDKIYGAISAYFLMGVIWSFVYTGFFIQDPTSFNVPEAWLSSDAVNSFWAVYFSFTTLTTLGYGDITPQTPLAQSYAMMEAVIGQVFLAVIVARLIALHISHERENDQKE
ncbi:potassium channel family protein [Pontiella agarivorans]|uniref:Potassium channel family protein n=1 Tax=Pontiella agarivorans TaxID=3038953 RepID=A0ABU5MZ51_9BACT|nr:potassium channel family protein [Pontiella agarivorans]MDZ8119467.1 potassium channel family protein [Pontiella agarivorans]